MKIIKPPKNKIHGYPTERSVCNSTPCESSHEKKDQSKSSKKAGTKPAKTDTPRLLNSRPQNQSNYNVEKSGNELDLEGSTGSEIDIFDNDNSWDKVEYSRTSQRDERFTKSRRYTKSQAARNPGAENSDVTDSLAAGSKSLKASFPKLETKKSRNKKLKNAHVEYQDNAPLALGKKRRRTELDQTSGQSALESLVDTDDKDFNSVLSRGMRLLAIREHSVLELTNKLLDKFDNVEASSVYAVVDELVKLKYVSDERFAEVYVRSRANKGFGPVKIKAELKSKGVSNSLIHDHLKESSGHWFDNADHQYLKKYGDGPVTDYNTWTKRARFMQSRGFTMEHIHVTLPKVEFD